VEEYDRLFVPRNDPKWLRRNALVALGNVGGPEHIAVLERHAGDEHADWALARIRERA
jgi:epoxyqueuosine reductase QueG